jgi:hypothetical protein
MPKGYNYIPGTKIPSMAKKNALGIYARVVGLREAVENVNLQLAKLDGITKAGLISICNYIYKDMQVTPPVVPVDTGNLNGSWFVSGSGYSKAFPYVKAGFKANYAVYVHEMIDEAYGKKINWKRPNSGPKFLEKALQRNKGKATAIMRTHIKGKML